jgi:apolipoprotein N-acyltransferase
LPLKVDMTRVETAEWKDRGLWRLPYLAGLGGMMALGLPPIGAWQLLFVVVPLVLAHLAKDHRSGTSTFSDGWVFGLGYFVVALHWIGVAFTVDASHDLWMMPFAVGGLAGVMAIYWGGAFLLAGLLRRGIGQWHVPSFVALPFSLGIAEMLRGVLFGGFPWAAPGLMATEMGGILQLASLIGMTGLSFLVLLWAGLPFGIYRYWHGSPSQKLFVAALTLSWPLAWAGGNAWLATHNTGFVPGVRLRLVQPNIAQDDKWRDDNAREIFEGLLAQSSAEALVRPSHIIWPESSVPFLLDESAAALSAIGRMLGEDRILLAGSIRRDAEIAGAGRSYYTSIEMIDGRGDVQARYDKWRLVPGGEYLPLAWLLEPLGFRKVVSLPESFSAGAGPRSFEVPGAGRAGLLICYEAIFPDRLVEEKSRPRWIVNVTNDGWFGNSVGPWQHLAQVRMRAVEQGMPIARAANTGISAVFDPWGRMIAHSPLMQRSVVDADLPVAAAETPYSRFGNWTAVLFMLVVGALTSLFFRQSTSEKSYGF